MKINLEQKNTLKALEDTKKSIEKMVQNTSFFNEFISPITVIDNTENQIFLEVKNSFAKQTLESDYKKMFEDVFFNLLNQKIEVYFFVDQEKNQIKDLKNRFFETKTTPKIQNIIKGLNKNYSFENFVVSNFNKEAFAAVKTIFSKRTLNPIFISGGVGLGKTHILQAIGNEFNKENQDKNIRYITSDEFIREVYNALSAGNNEIEKLKDAFQSYDLLLIDDVQFLAKKEKINEIFFNIFNYNIQNGKFIILSSDKPPHLLTDFADRMKSRFHSGLYIKINKPDLDSIRSILDKKIKENEDHFIFTKDAIDYIAHRNNTDIRKLEGFLHRILFYALNNLPPKAIITSENIKLLTEKDKSEEIQMLGFDIDPNILINQICAAYFISPDVVKSKTRIKQATFVRHVCMYVMREKYNMPYTQIGSYFNGRDHSTIIDSVTKIKKMLEKDESLKSFLQNIYNKL